VARDGGKTAPDCYECYSFHDSRPLTLVLGNRIVSWRIGSDASEIGFSATRKSAVRARFDCDGKRIMVTLGRNKPRNFTAA
jgi:hypothetical protein